MVQYLCCLIDIHSYDILRTSSNKCYSKFIKQDAIDRMLNNNESIWSVSLDIGLPGDGCYIIGLKNIRKTVII